MDGGSFGGGCVVNFLDGFGRHCEVWTWVRMWYHSVTGKFATRVNRLVPIVCCGLRDSDEGRGNNWRRVR